MSRTSLSLPMMSFLLLNHQLAQVKDIQVLLLCGFTYLSLRANKYLGVLSQQWLVLTWDCKMWMSKFSKCQWRPPSIKWTYGTFLQRTSEYSSLFIQSIRTRCYYRWMFLPWTGRMNNILRKFKSVKCGLLWKWNKKENKQPLKTGERVREDKKWGVEELMQDYQK